MSVTVACCQVELEVGRAKRNRQACVEAAAAAASAGAEIIVLPELANSGYVFSDPAEARALAEPLDGPTVSALEALAQRARVVVVSGLCESDTQHGVLRNSAVIVDEQGLRAVYRKAHLWGREPEFFQAGDAPPAVLDTRFGRLGTMVCYDIEFPEWVRGAALMGAQLLCVPTNWPAEPCPPGERSMEVVRAQAAASVNRVFIACADRAATERGVVWVNGTVIAGPDGYPLAGPVYADRAATITAQLELRQADDKSLGPRNDVFADRRPELYRDLLS